MEHTEGQTENMRAIVRALLTKGKGILAADESITTMNKRLEAIGAVSTPEIRHDYRELLFTAPGIEAYLSGVILYDESIRSKTSDGVPFADFLTVRGIIPGVKGDMGTVHLEGFPGELVTEGLDGLASRLAAYYALGARFTKWRAVINIDKGLPTDACLKMNSFIFARYAALSQAAGMVPIVEPEVMLHGDHSLVEAQEVTTRTLQRLFAMLKEYRVDLGGLILKSSMVLAGDAYKGQSSPEEVADATLRTFHLSVPEEVPGIVLLSGGQTPKRATENLQAIARHGAQPWQITFSYSRALEEPVLTAWKGDTTNKEVAQRALLHRLMLNAKAQTGDYEPALEESL
jgi:fructose-bisphosphate aldolase class I